MPGSILSKGYWGLAGLGGLYIAFLGLLTVPWIQKNFVYLHKVKIPIWIDLSKPEQMGFASNQITPFWLTTPDNERLFAWHILPLGLYAQHRDELRNRDIGVAEDISKTLPFQLLQEDPEARLILYFHGNAGNVAQGFRPAAYRAWTGVHSEKVHIITFDYRGFGRSSGTPSEDGLILDAVTAIKFALDTVGIDAKRVVVLGHSLGTAVALGATEVMAREHNIELGGIILCSAFSKLKSLIMTYSLGGVLPILSPLNQYPAVQKWFVNFVREPWDGEERMKSLIQHSPKMNITMIHAHNDYDIAWVHSQILFHTAANAIVAKSRRERGDTNETDISKPLQWDQIEVMKERTELGDEGWVDKWIEGVPSGGWRVEHRMVKWGGHDEILVSSSVSLVIRQMLGL